MKKMMSGLTTIVFLTILGCSNVGGMMGGSNGRDTKDSDRTAGMMGSILICNSNYNSCVSTISPGATQAQKDAAQKACSDSRDGCMAMMGGTVEMMNR